MDSKAISVLGCFFHLLHWFHLLKLDQYLVFLTKTSSTFIDNLLCNCVSRSTKQNPYKPKTRAALDE